MITFVSLVIVIFVVIMYGIYNHDTSTGFLRRCTKLEFVRWAAMSAFLAFAIAAATGLFIFSVIVVIKIGYNSGFFAVLP